MSDATANTKPVQSKGGGGRSPAYPYIPLSKALDRAADLKKAEGFYAVPPESAYKAWDFGAKSSGARQTLAALKHFGLVEYTSLGDDRKVKLTDLAKHILLDVVPDSPKRAALVRQAALTPAIHADLMKEYPNGLPSDTTVQVFLTLEKDFNESGARDLIAEFRDTFAFAGLGEPGKMPPSDDAQGESFQAREVEVGDLVQIEINGALSLEKPERVQEIRDHDGVKWVLVEGSKAWVQMEQVIFEAKGSPMPPPLPTPAPAPAVVTQAGMQTDAFSLDEGVVSISFPEGLTADSVADLEAFFELFIKKAKRRAGVAANAKN